MTATPDERGFSKHASTRVQQRSIPPVLVEYLLDYGHEEPAPGGCTRISFDTKAWRKVDRAFGPAAKHIERYRNIYAIVGDGHVVTVAYSH